MSSFLTSSPSLLCSPLAKSRHMLKNSLRWFRTQSLVVVYILYSCLEIIFYLYLLWCRFHSINFGKHPLMSKLGLSSFCLDFLYCCQFIIAYYLTEGLCIGQLSCIFVAWNMIVLQWVLTLEMTGHEGHWESEQNYLK